MLPANAKILICPFCGGEKPVLQLLSGNIFGGTQWSDLKAEYPMLPRPSAVQKCPHCGKYYFLSNVDRKEGDDYSNELGELTYAQIKEALIQFENDSLPTQNEINLRLLFVYLYNDTFQREYVSKDDKPTEEDKVLFRTQVVRLMQIWEMEPLIMAELYREIEEFDQCITLLDSMEIEDAFIQKIAEKVKELAHKHETYAFLIEK